MQEGRGRLGLPQRACAEAVEEHDADRPAARHHDGREPRVDAEGAGGARQHRGQARLAVGRNDGRDTVAADVRPAGHRLPAAAAVIEDSTRAKATASASAESPSASALTRSDRSSAVMLPDIP